MGDWRLFVLVLLAALNKHSYCLDWSDWPQDNDVLSVCVGDDVTFPWDFLTAPNEEVQNVTWEYETNSTSKLIAFYSSGENETGELYSHRVSFESDGSLTMTDITMKDSGMYNISVETQDQNGVGCYQRSVALQVKDSMLTEDRKVHVRQEGGAKWDNTSNTFTLTLSCGTFRFTDLQSSLQVEWTTPTGDTLNSTDYSNGRFYLSLLAPVVGGTYTCRIPPQHLSHTCLNDSRNDNNFVRVDSIQINVLQTVFEHKTLKEEAKKLNDRIVNLDSEDQKRKAENEKLIAENKELKVEDEKLKAEIEKLKAEDKKLFSRITKDRCPRSWTLHGESCYKYISVATTWQNAQGVCDSMEARLVEIDSEAENSFVFNMVHSEGAVQAWLGLSDIEVEGLFLLPSGQPPAFTKWQPGEPNNSGGREDCAVFWPDRLKYADRWNDAPCGDDKPFVCEQHEKLKAENEKLKAEVEKLKAEDEKLKAEDDKLNAKEEKLKAEDEKLKAEHDKLKAEDEKLKAEDEKLKAEDEKLRAEDEKLKAEDEKLNAEDDKLKAEDDKLKAIDDKLKVENEKLTAKDEKLKAEDEKLKEEDEKLKAEIEKLKAEDEKLKAEDKKLKAEGEKLKAETKKLNAKDEKLKGEDDKLKAEDEKLKAEDEKLKVENEKLTAKDEKLKAEDDKLKPEIKKLKAEDEKLKAEDEKMLSQITKAKCPRSWTLHGESCYKYISVATTWQNAQIECESMEARLVEIDSEAENSFVFNITVSEGARNAWLGLSDVGTEGLFLLPSGQPPTFTKWRPGEPNDSRGREDCAMFLHNSAGRWNDAPCDIDMRFVCEQHVLF